MTNNTTTRAPNSKAQTPASRLYVEAKEKLRLAEGLLECLNEAHGECETQLDRLQKRDPIRSVTGKSSIDVKITSTERMVESLRRVVAELESRIEKRAATGA